MTFATKPKSQGHAQPPKRATSVIYMNWQWCQRMTSFPLDKMKWIFRVFFLFFLYIKLTFTWPWKSDDLLSGVFSPCLVLLPPHLWDPDYPHGSHLCPISPGLLKPASPSALSQTVFVRSGRPVPHVSVSEFLVYWVYVLLGFCWTGFMIRFLTCYLLSLWTVWFKR